MIPSAPVAARWLQDVWGQAVAGVDQDSRLTLVEAVQRGSATGQRLSAIRGYWQLCGQLMLRDLARDQLARIDELEPFATQQPGSLWNAIRDDARANVRLAELDLAQAQLNALTLMSPGPAGVRPVPVEGPYIGAYRTNFETLFSGGGAPLAMRRLHETLPLELAAIESRAEAVAAHTNAANAVAQAHQQAQTNLTRLLDALERLGKQRELLVRLIVRYNEHIAEYALTVGGSASDATVAAMLIPSPIVPEATLPLSNVPPATFLPPRGLTSPGEMRPISAVESLQPVPQQSFPNQPATFREVAPEQPPSDASGLMPPPG